MGFISALESGSFSLLFFSPWLSVFSRDGEILSLFSVTFFSLALSSSELDSLNGLTGLSSVPLVIPESISESFSVSFLSAMVTFSMEFSPRGRSWLLFSFNVSSTSGLLSITVFAAFGFSSSDKHCFSSASSGIFSWKLSSFFSVPSFSMSPWESSNTRPFPLSFTVLSFFSLVSVSSPPLMSSSLRSSWSAMTACSSSDVCASVLRLDTGLFLLPNWVLSTSFWTPPSMTFSRSFLLLRRESLALASFFEAFLKLSLYSP